MGDVVYDIPEWIMELAARYGIEPYEIMQVLSGPRPRLPRKAVGAGGLTVLMIIGRTSSGARLRCLCEHSGSSTTKLSEACP
ncbi:hypothetical protein ACIRRA_42955 [Nocardia sp. NPDC101769]|uniref:hypothetical protein n=1 Tax=Nocardia sp. NPDC101769 TaxID=3364333 RepID=UPI0037FA7CD8